MRRTFFTLLWGALFFFVSLVLQCVVFAEYFRVPSQEGDGAAYEWNQSWKYVHMAVGVAGLFMGAFGWLPGAHRRGEQASQATGEESKNQSSPEPK
jgi:hypothetical protein